MSAEGACGSARATWHPRPVVAAPCSCVMAPFSLRPPSRAAGAPDFSLLSSAFRRFFVSSQRFFVAFQNFSSREAKMVGDVGMVSSGGHDSWALASCRVSFPLRLFSRTFSNLVASTLAIVNPNPSLPACCNQ